MRRQLANRFCLLLMALATAVLLPAGCGPGAGGSPTEPTTSGSLVGGLPSISELAGTRAAEVPPLPELVPAQVADGRELYGSFCAECHGANLEGEEAWQTPNDDGSFRAPPHDASGHTWHHDDKVLLETIRLGGTRLTGQMAGASNMPAFEQSLTGDEMTAILSYIKSSWPDDIRMIQWERTVQAP